MQKRTQSMHIGEHVKCYTSKLSINSSAWWVDQHTVRVLNVLFLISSLNSFLSVRRLQNNATVDSRDIVEMTILHTVQKAKFSLMVVSRAPKRVQTWGNRVQLQRLFHQLDAIVVLVKHGTMAFVYQLVHRNVKMHMIVLLTGIITLGLVQHVNHHQVFCPTNDFSYGKSS